ncbi:LOW QUALITY PROTEIN: arginine/serine-rich coiled-coil protein 2 [Diabrotica virgifera virgifera]|uniref:Arginine/serine-rich coiled-coil protein 2-like n=2 Tax=Diabrotica virgifera virgifera TaxID=50390 RepID=A0ABM5K916_DIAVI|nr:LOW QUALITY PROTEIN: arginine/serine-rich coiled-coil protein 2 [Diabrotica virgifera virgifera]
MNYFLPFAFNYTCKFSCGQSSYFPQMNPARVEWDIPPPPGTEDDLLPEPINDDPGHRSEKEMSIEKEDETQENEPTGRLIDLVNPYLKNPEYVEYEKRCLDRRFRSKSRSHSRERFRRRHSRSRSRSKGRSRRSRSRSRRRRRRYSSSKSRSRSPAFTPGGYYQRHRHKRRRSPKHSRSKSRSKSHSRSHKSSSKLKHRRSVQRSSEERDTDIQGMNSQFNQSVDDNTKDNVFKNDGSFLEMFKKMQEQQKKVEEPPPVVAPKPIPIFGKRRGGKVLKTGMVQKPKPPTSEESSSRDAWSMYMSEVRKYKAACCDDDSKSRPLVK